VSDVSDLFVAHDGHVVVDVHVQPGSGRTAVVGRHGAALKLRVAAPPTEGRANEAAGELLARTLGVKPAAVSLVSGASSRSKRYKVEGVDGDETATALRRAIDEANSAPGGGRRTPRG
jgi:uncharacterized protein (TIGR00251 family)